MYGIYFDCLSCDNFLLCFKCYRSRVDLHPGHDFIDHGCDWDSDDEAESETSSADGHIDQDAGQENGFVEDDFDNEVVGNDEDSLGDIGGGTGGGTGSGTGDGIMDREIL